MKKLLPASLLVVQVLVISLTVSLSMVSFGQIYSNTFTGTGACPTQGNAPTTSANATGTALTRSTMMCTSTANVFNSSALNNTATINTTSYIEFSVTAAMGAQLNVSSLSFFRQASAAAPNKLAVSYSTDGFLTSTSWGAVPNTPTTGAIITWDFADFVVPSGTTLTFRFYPYGTQRADLGAGTAASNGTFRLDNVTLNGMSPLPVSFVSFTGKSASKMVVLNWVTAWEKENQGFEIQKSTNAQSFEGVGFVTGTYNTELQSVYTFTDADVLPEQLYYYRLKQNDLGGGFAYSSITSVRVKAGENDEKFSVFPNPNKGIFMLSGGSLNAANVKLYTLSGLEIPIGLIPAGNGKTLEITARGALMSGIYLLKINAGDGTPANVLKVVID